VARYGGDEFVVILSDTQAELAKPLIERFLAIIAEPDVTFAGDDFSVCCSVAFTEAHDKDSALTLMERADAALYEAKATGRHLYRYAPPSSNEIGQMHD